MTAYRWTYGKETAVVVRFDEHRIECHGVPQRAILAELLRLAVENAALEGLQDDGWETVDQLCSQPGARGTTYLTDYGYEYRVQRRPVKDAPTQGGKP